MAHSRELSAREREVTSPKRRLLGRRGFLIGAGILGTVGAIAACCGGSFFGNMYLKYRDAKQTNLGDLSFKNKLAIPPLVQPDIDSTGAKHFKLTLQTGTSTFVDEREIKTWGINGSYLGPTIRASHGDEIVMEVTNSLPEDSTIHWHGAHLPAKMDGGPHQMINKGATWRPTWTIDQAAATLWYHPHPHGQTATHVYRGVAGLFFIDDEASQSAGLPEEYGVDDIPLILQDKAFNKNGSLDFQEPSFLEEVASAGHQGVLGDTILVNGTYDPYLTVTTTAVRFRLLNASNARIYNLGFTDGRRFALVATDNGLLDKPVSLTKVQISPGERVEIVASFSAGEETVLRSYEQELGAAGFLAERHAGADDVFDVMKIRAADILVSSPALPTTLPGQPDIKVPKHAKTRTFKLSGNKKINREEMAMDRIDAVIPAGAIEIWEVSSSEVHSFHVHGATYRILSFGGKKPPSYLRGPKDTVLVPSSALVRLAVAFEKYTDPTFPYMFHCHILRHEDDGMMGQFTVVDPGTESGAPRKVDSPHRHGS